MPTHTAKPCKDHLGNCYSSFSAMCKAYNKPGTTVRNRLDRNWTLEQALTIDNNNTNAKINPIKIWTDHVGNTFPSVRAMAEHYGITEKIFWSRKRVCKWPLEKILTTPVQDQESPANAKPIECNGISFKSVNALCKYYKIPRTTFKLRLQQGYTPEEAVKIQPKEITGFASGSKKCIDPWGNEFKSQAAMYRHYGTTKDIAAGRFAHGWTLEQILMNPEKIDPHKPCIGPDGKEYAGFKIMAESFGVTEGTLRGRLVQGYSLEDALLNWDNHLIVTDHLGNRFNSKADLYEFWNTTTSTFNARLKHHDEISALELISPNTTFDDLTVSKKITKDYYEIILNGKEYIWSKKQIWTYFHNNHQHLLVKEI